MPIPTSRTKELAEILIDVNRCGCGLCIEVCKSFNLVLDNGKVICQDSVYGCIGCVGDFLPHVVPIEKII